MTGRSAERQLWWRRAAEWICPVLALAVLLAHPAAAASKPQQLVDSSRIAVEDMLDSPEFTELPNYLEKAKGVLIFPQLIKGGFIIGAEGGSGVLLVKDGNDRWSSPAFYTLAAGSIGLQIGGQVSQVIFTIMNEGAVDAILNSQFKLGADASVAVGPIGGGIEASTTLNFELDVYAFSKAAGLYGGGAFEGAAILEREAWNSEYFGRPVSARDIVIDRKVDNPSAKPLKRVLARADPSRAETATGTPRTTD